MRLSKKQLSILENNFYVSTINYSNGDYLALEAWTNGGVDMFIEIPKNSKKTIIDELNNYINNFDIDEEIELYRQDKLYRSNFTITESLHDFQSWISWIKSIIKELEKLNKQGVRK